MLSTDNFEFLADFNPVKNLRFVSEVCGLSLSKLSPETISIGDTLIYQLEKNNPFDKNAVKVFKGKMEIGYIKVIHSKVFHKKLKSRLNIVVKSIDKNGSINRIFVDISFSD